MTRYLDMTGPNGAVGWICGEGEEIIPAGTTIYPINALDRDSAPFRHAESLGITFTYEDAPAPAVDFYATPRLDVFAFDTAGGFYATCGAATDIDEGQSHLLCDRRTRMPARRR